MSGIGEEFRSEDVSVAGQSGNSRQGAPEGGNLSRRTIDILRSRLDILAGEDKLLMTMHLEYGASYRQMARLAGVVEATIARRIRRMAAMLVSGQYVACLRMRHRLTWRELDFARDYYVKGQSLRQIRAKRGWSSYRARKTLAKIRSLLRQARRTANGKHPGTRRAQRREASGHRRGGLLRKPDPSAAPQDDKSSEGQDDRSSVRGSSGETVKIKTGIK